MREQAHNRAQSSASNMPPRSSKKKPSPIVLKAKVSPPPPADSSDGEEEMEEDEPTNMSLEEFEQQAQPLPPPPKPAAGGVKSKKILANGLQAGWFALFDGEPKPHAYHSVRAMTVAFKYRGLGPGNEDAMRAFIKRRSKKLPAKARSFAAFKGIRAIWRNPDSYKRFPNAYYGNILADRTEEVDNDELNVDDIPWPEDLQSYAKSQSALEQ